MKLATQSESVFQAELSYCILCFYDEDGLCNDCTEDFNVCINCIAYGEGNLCANCESSDEGICLDNDLQRALQYISENDEYFEKRKEIL